MRLRAGRRVGSGAEAGMVTAETAVVLPAIVLVLALALTGVRVGVDQVRCIDAARAAARAAARGDSEAQVRSLAARGAPDGAVVTLARNGDDVEVTVVADPVGDLPLLGRLPAPTGRAVAVVEGQS